MSPAPLLSLSDFRVAVAGRTIVHGVDLTIQEGDVHAIMGPNGSGKSTLVSALAGHPAYAVSGSAHFLGEDLLALSPDRRAVLGLLLAFQYPREIAGVSLRSFLLAAHRVRSEAGLTDRLSPLQFDRALAREMEALAMDPAFADRPVNKGFSGGEKKKAEILQMAMLRPRLALLDETDSGLDVDALKIVGAGINRLRGMTNDQIPMTNSPNPQSPIPNLFSALIVTHYARILEHVVPDHVHVMIRGKIVESGGADLAHRLEKEGYARYGVTEEGGIALG
jgi:Fe-S cluster assembly ATP-binding protein